MAFDGPNTATNLSEKIRLTRESLGVGRTEFANLLGMNAVGERTVRGWETGEHIPTKKKLANIAMLVEKIEQQKQYKVDSEEIEVVRVNQKGGDYLFLNLVEMNFLIPI